MKSNAFKNKKGPASRKENIRDERNVGLGATPKLVFSFKDFDDTQVPPGQSFQDWQSKGLLSTFLENLKHMGEWTVQEACQNDHLTIYGKWPDKSDFRPPKHIAADVKWAVLKSVGGQKIRVAGHIINNVFYVVFLDKEHVFWKMAKR